MCAPVLIRICINFMPDYVMYYFNSDLKPMYINLCLEVWSARIWNDIF
jgi:hypothetical protein